MAGFIKSTMSPENVVKAGVIWATSVPELLLHFIGACELLAAIGLIFPSMLRIKPQLTAYAGWGLVAIMSLAIVFHITHGEFMYLP